LEAERKTFVLSAGLWYNRDDTTIPADGEKNGGLRGNPMAEALAKAK
jgi:hypothetical protein